MTRYIVVAMMISVMMSVCFALPWRKPDAENKEKDEHKAVGFGKIKHPKNKEDKKNKSMFECFPANSWVIKEDNTRATMASLEIGDRVKTGANSYSSIFMFSHAERSGNYEFISLNNLTVSANHYLYTQENGLVPAREVRMGDHLVIMNGQSEKVNRIKAVRGKGLYNPHTLDGRIVVDGYITNTYTEAVPERVATPLLAPFRMAFSTFGRDFSMGTLERNTDLRSKLVYPLVY